MGLFLSALAPIVVYLYVIRRVDRYDPEPKKLLFKLWVLGAFATLPILGVELGLERLSPYRGSGSELEALYMAFVVAALTEEVFKWLVLKVWAYRNRAYDERLDGIVYGVFVGLGFAAIENILYVVSNSMSVAVIRSVTAVPAHMLFGVIMGYYLSRKKFAKSKLRANYASFMSIAMPILLHGIYDYLLMSHHGWMLIFFIPYMIIMWVFGIRSMRRYYLESKEAEAHRAELESVERLNVLLMKREEITENETI